MPTVPTNNQQKTSFWDFWHKKVYINRHEKLYDFFVGIPIAVLLFFILVCAWSNIHDFMASRHLIDDFYMYFFDGCPACYWINSDILGIFIFLPYMLFLIFVALKRRYLFFGASLITVPLALIVFMFSIVGFFSL